MMDNHNFTPSRLGTVCVAWRDMGDPDGPFWSEPCGYPAGHPIHAMPSDEIEIAELRQRDDDRAIALADLAALRAEIEGYRLGDYAALLARLDRIEAALRGVR